MNASSRIAIVSTLLYVSSAVYMVADDRASTAGGWINLNGLVSGIATLPVTAFCEEILGVSLNYQSNLHMGIAILLCAAMVYFATNKAVSLAQRLFA